MKSNCIYIVIYFLLIAVNLHAKSDKLNRIDHELTTAFKSVTTAEYDARYDSVAPAFKRLLIKRLANPVTFDNSLDSLSNYIAVLASDDKRIKFYGWDDLTGGTWHNINALAQFKGANGKIIVQQLNTDSDKEENYSDSQVYELHQITIEKKTYYLTFAWGTHGAGNQHNIIRVYTINGNRLEKCASCFAAGSDPVIEYPRFAKSDLKYDPELQEISYHEFNKNEETGFYDSTGAFIRLRLINGVFTRQ